MAKNGNRPSSTSIDKTVTFDKLKDILKKKLSLIFDGNFFKKTNWP